MLPHLPSDPSTCPSALTQWQIHAKAPADHSHDPGVGLG